MSNKSENNQEGFIKRINNYQPNTLTTSRQSYTLQEKRILSYVINQFNHKDEYVKDKNVRFKIPINELAQHMNYTEAKSAAQGLLTKQIRIENPESKQFITKNLFVTANYNVDNSGVLEMTVSADCVADFINLGQLYTRYNLEMFLSFSSKYTQRIYELIMLHAGRKQFDFSIDLKELKEMIDATNYTGYSDFRRKVLEVAQKELSEKTDFSFEISTNGKQRNISRLTFKIFSWKRNAQSEVNIDLQNFINAPTINQYNGIKQIIEKNYQFRKEQIAKILNSEELREKFVEIDAKINVGLIEIKTTKTRYMSVALGFNKSESKF